MCYQFPYEPLECKKCNKLFCKYCQLQLQQGVPAQQEDLPPIERLSEDRLAQMSPRQRKEYAAAQYARQQQQFKMKQGMTPGYDVCCPNCQARGDFMHDVNKVLRNCIDFCEFPHRCYNNDKNGEIIWKTMRELQEHAMFDCPKFGCDICYHEDF